MTSQGGLGDLTPIGGILAIIAGILMIAWVGPTLSSALVSLERLIVYGTAFILILAGSIAVLKLFW